jgi:hypothetical protein
MHDPSSEVLKLIAGLAVTTGLLVFATVTGIKGQRRRHLLGVGLAITSFVITVLLAEQLGRSMVFDADAMRVHMFFAHAATYALLAVLISGAVRLARPQRARTHRIAVVAFAVLLLGAVATGWHMLASAPAPDNHPDDYQQPATNVVQAGFHKENR